MTIIQLDYYKELYPIIDWYKKHYRTINKYPNFPFNKNFMLVLHLADNTDSQTSYKITLTLKEYVPDIGQLTDENGNMTGYVDCPVNPENAGDFLKDYVRCTTGEYVELTVKYNWVLNGVDQKIPDFPEFPIKILRSADIRRAIIEAAPPDVSVLQREAATLEFMCALDDTDGSRKAQEYYKAANKSLNLSGNDSSMDNQFFFYGMALFAVQRYVLSYKQDLSLLTVKKYEKTGKGKGKKVHKGKGKKNTVRIDKTYTIEGVTPETKRRKPVISCDCWGVRGHYRHYKDGKVVFIPAYLKGKKRKLGQPVNQEYKLHPNAESADNSADN